MKDLKDYSPVFILAAQHKYPHLSKKEAVKKRVEDMSSYGKAGKGNKNPWLKNNPEAARAIRNGTYKRGK